MNVFKYANWRALASTFSGMGAAVALLVLLVLGMLTAKYGQRVCEYAAASYTGLTPDMRVRSAIINRNLTELRRLLDDGASVDVPNCVGSTAVHDATSTRDPEVMAIVAAHSRDIDHVDNSGATPLFVAVSMEEPALVQALLQHGASPFAGRTGGLTVYELAQRRASSQILSLIETSAVARGPSAR